jgi:gas vesicle protein
MKEIQGARQQTRRRGGAVKTVGVFALGAATGGVIALLFAPASGRVTRRRIAQKLRVMRREATQRIGSTGKLLARKAVTLRKAASQRLRYARSWVATHVSNGHATPSRQPRRVAHHA